MSLISPDIVGTENVNGFIDLIKEHLLRTSFTSQLLALNNDGTD
jgi:hypothetical protein